MLRVSVLRVSGYWLLATSILHVLVGLVVFTKPMHGNRPQRLVQYSRSRSL